MGQYLTNQYHYQFSGLIFNVFELWLFIGTIAISIISAFVITTLKWTLGTLKKEKI